MRLITQLLLYKIPKLELETKPESGRAGSGYEVKVAIIQLEDSRVKRIFHDVKLDVYE